jgi:hypothetical protein
MLELTMNSIATVHPCVRGRLALIAVGLFTLLASFAVTAPAQAGYYGGYGYNPCSYGCGYPAYHYYPRYRYHHGCYSCGSRVVFERRFVEREYVERSVGYGGYHRHYCGYDPCYGRRYGYYPYGYHPYGYGGYRPYGYGGIGRRWPLPYIDPGPYAAGGYDEPPRPPAAVWGDE